VSKDVSEECIASSFRDEVLKMQAVCFSETTYKSIGNYNPGDQHWHLHGPENLSLTKTLP
jgi:hypothetical protein